MSEIKHTEGPWEYVPSNENHGPYVANGWGAGDICDCYTMTKPDSLSVANGGDSKPVPFQGDEADANARLIAAAPDMLEALQALAEDRRLALGGTHRRRIAAVLAKATGGSHD